MNRIELVKKIDKMKNEIKALEYELETKFKNYETILILTEDITYKDYTEIKNKTKEIMSEVTITEELGTKKLAYRIKSAGKQKTYEEGIYLVFHWIGSEKAVAELEKYWREEDNILKFLTIRVNENENEEE